MTINGTLIISKYAPSRVERDIIWIDISTDIPKIKHFSGNGWVILNDIPIGTTADTVAAGNHNHAITAHATSGLSAAADIQALAQALSTRIKALENAVVTP